MYQLLVDKDQQRLLNLLDEEDIPQREYDDLNVEDDEEQEDEEEVGLEEKVDNKQKKNQKATPKKQKKE